MLAALEAQEARLSARDEWERQRSVFESTIKATIPGIRIIGETAPRLWNTVLLILPEYSNVKWLARLSREGFQVSTGSACSSGGGASEVLAAMRLPQDDPGRVLRISAMWDHTPEDWDALAAAMVSVHHSLQAQRGTGSS
jgi:cysteine desulfurase